MRRILFLLLLLVITLPAVAQQRRPVDSEHPLWLIHVDVWNKADPQKIIRQIPEDIRPYVCMNLSLSCGYDTQRQVYKMPQNAIRTYKSWASICQANGLFFTCQPASGGHTHLMDDDLETFEYFYRHYPNFLGWNYAEQFWGFDEPNDHSSSTQTDRIALFAKLVEMAHQYGGFLTISFCGNIWSHALNPIGMMKRNADLLAACQQYPEAILWLYKYTTSSCFYNNESVCFGPFVSGLTRSYGVRYDNCGWNGALDALYGERNGHTYPIAAGIGTVMEQTCQNGGCVWDGPELIWTEDFQELSPTTVSGYTRRNWGTYPGFRNVWLDMFHKVLDGSLYIPSQQEVQQKTKIIVVNDVNSGNDEDKYAAWGDLYDGLYKQTDPFNRGNGQWMDNFCYFKRTGRYGAIPITLALNDSLAQAIPNQVKKSQRTSVWRNETVKRNQFNEAYPKVSEGDLFVSRYRNQLVTYTPYTYVNSHKYATADIDLQYNTCQQLQLTLGKLGTAHVREYADSICFYLNNYRTDTIAQIKERIVVTGASQEPTFSLERRVDAKASTETNWDAATGTYTLEVTHMGPLDLVLYAAGDATADRLTDYLPCTPLSLPRQPEPFCGELIIEAEDMDYKNIRSCVVDPYNWYPNTFGHSGNGFADMGTNKEGGLKAIFARPEAIDYDVTIRYTSPQKSGNVVAKFNSTQKSLKFEKTALNEWRKVTLTGKGVVGNNTLLINNNQGIDCYIDQVIITPAGTPAEQFLVTLRPSDLGTVTASHTEAAEGTEVTLQVTPKTGYRHIGWNIIHGDIQLTEQGTFVMPDDNVTLQPLFESATAIYTLDFSTVLNGTLPAGWRATQENNEVHQYPNSYGSGARSFTGFTGAYPKALYWRSISCDYGCQPDYPLYLEPGDYTLTYVMAAWKGTPRYRARLLTANDGVIAESGYQEAAPNANGNTAAYLSTATQHQLEFTIRTAGQYVIRFENEGTGFSEFLLADCRINSVIDPEAIQLPTADNQLPALHIGQTLPEGYRNYDAQGRELSALQSGLNLIRRQGQLVRKVFLK